MCLNYIWETAAEICLAVPTFSYIDISQQFPEFLRSLMDRHKADKLSKFQGITQSTIFKTTLWGGTVVKVLCYKSEGRSLVRSQLVSVEFFTDIKSFRSQYGSGVDSASNRNEYQEYFLGVKAASV